MRAFYNAEGVIIGYVESEHEDGFTIDGMTSRKVMFEQTEVIRQEMKVKTNIGNSKDIKPPKEIKPNVTPNPKV